MAHVPPTVIFLTGAPEDDSIDWDEHGLMSRFSSPVSRFLGEAVLNEPTTPTQTSQPLPRWRRVPLLEQRQNGKEPALDQDATRFWSSWDHAAARRHHVDFFEHSLAVLQNIDSSQIELPEGTAPDQTAALASTSLDASLLTCTDSLATSFSERSEQQIISFSGPITDLNRIPNARRILSIHPQTMTVNILAGVISVQPTRTVRTRKNNVEMDIIEVFLGDETRAGFSVSFWLPAIASRGQPTPAKEQVRDLLTGLRNGNILLVTHIALSEFQGNVYGQSLSKRITRNDTTVHVLSDDVLGLSAPNAAKLQRVRQWCIDFLGRKHAVSPSPVDRSGWKRRRLLHLPPDTQ